MIQSVNKYHIYEIFASDGKFYYSIPKYQREYTWSYREWACTDNANVKRLIAVIGNKELSVKSMMNALELKGRDNFLNLYLKPAIGDGYVCLPYLNSSRHPRQKYLLTVKGLAVYDDCIRSK